MKENINQIKIKNTNGFKRKCAIRYSTQKTNAKKLRLEKSSVRGSVALVVTDPKQNALLFGHINQSYFNFSLHRDPFFVALSGQVSVCIFMKYLFVSVWCICLYLYELSVCWFIRLFHTQITTKQTCWSTVMNRLRVPADSTFQAKSTFSTLLFYLYATLNVNYINWF